MSSAPRHCGIPALALAITGMSPATATIWTSAAQCRAGCCRSSPPWRRHPVREPDTSGRAVDTHHRATGRVKTQGHSDGEVRHGTAAFDRRFNLLHRGHRLDPEQIGASLGKACRLLSKDISSVGRVERTKRREEFAGRTHRACDENPSLNLVDNVTGMTSSLAIDLDDTVVEFVQLETEARATERVRQDDVGAGVDVGLVESVDGLGVIEIEALGASPASRPAAISWVPVAPSTKSTPRSASNSVSTVKRHRSEPYGLPRG